MSSGVKCCIDYQASYMGVLLKACIISYLVLPTCIDDEFLRCRQNVKPFSCNAV